MMISTKGRYALRVMVDLAEHSDGSYIPMREVAKRQDISLKYLEKILPALSKNNYITGIHGKGGGYKLTKTPEEYKAGDIIRTVEGEALTVACLNCNVKECNRMKDCRTRPMWNELQSIVNNYLDSVTVADLMKNKNSENL